MKETEPFLPQSPIRRLEEGVCPEEGKLPVTVKVEQRVRGARWPSVFGLLDM